MKNNTLPTIAITGASGFLGTELVRHFSQAGWKVVALVRKPGTNTPQVEYRPYDLAKHLAANTLDDIDYLVHAAYVKFDAKTPNALDVNVEAARELLELSRRKHVKRNIFISTMSAHEKAVSVYGKQKLGIESLFNSKQDTVIRSGLILGNGGIVKQMASFMKSKHMVPLIGGGKQPLQVVAVYDLVRAIELICTKNVSGKLVVATPEVYAYKDFYKSLSKSLDVRVLFVPIPFGLLLGMFKAAAFLHLPLGVGEDNLMGLKMLRSMDSAADLKRIGVNLDTLDTALSKTSLQ